MKYGIFDSRPQHSCRPFLFQDQEKGTQEYAIYDSYEEAENDAIWMNKLSTLTTYVVKPIK